MNTSASLDGLILDKPGIQLVLDRNKNVQTDLGHIPYILNSKAMEVATNYKELVHVPTTIVVMALILKNKLEKILQKNLSNAPYDTQYKNLNFLENYPSWCFYENSV